MMTSTPPPSTGGGAAAGGRMSDSGCSITDLTLEQALIRIKEIEDENKIHRDNLRVHNAAMREQCENLALWRKREHEKFEQAKALITELREKNQEMQVQMMTMKDKEKETSAQLAVLMEEKSHLLRQKAINEQRTFNLLKQAEEQGVQGLVTEVNDDSEAGTLPDNIVFVSTSEKEAEIAKLETAVAFKDDAIAQLRANVLKKEQDIESMRVTTQQLLKDMQNQQRLKNIIEEDNRSLTQRLMHTERQMHEQMQSSMANTRRVMQTPLQSSMEGNLPCLVTENGAQAGDSKSILVSYPDNPDDIKTTLQSLNADKLREQVKKDLERKVEEGQRVEKTLQKQVDNLANQVKELNLELNQEKLRSSKDLETLSQQYEEKLKEVVQQNKEYGNQSIQATTTGDVSILRSQVLSLIKEVDEINTKNSALTATLHLKDEKINKLEKSQRSLMSEHGMIFEERSRLLETLRSSHCQQEQAQQENMRIKADYQKLGDSFSQLVTDYKELEEMFETHRNEAKQSATKFQTYRQQTVRQQEEKLAQNTSKQRMEEINRLTAQVIAAEEAMRCKDEEIARLKSADEYRQLFKIQAEQYKSDFDAEREARVKLAEEKVRQREELDAMREQNRQLKEENNLVNLQKLNNMQARHSAVPTLPHGTWPFPQFPGNAQGMASASPSGGELIHQPGAAAMSVCPPRPERPVLPIVTEAVGPRPAVPVLGGGIVAEDDLSSVFQYQCPKCSAHFPDEDTVQLHVTECLEKD